MSIPQKIGDLLRQQFVLRKLNTPTGWILLIGISLLLGWAMAMTGTKGSLAILGGIIGGPMLLYCFLDLRFGVALTLVTAFLIGLISKYTYQPIGIALDLFLFILSFSLIVRLSQERDFRYFKHPISLFILAWIYYNIFQVLNPNAESRMAWLYTVRSLAVLHFLFFITCYAFKDLKSTLNMIKIILALGLISALYGLKQEFIGFTSREIAWLYEDEERFQLIVQWDRFRIFSFFSDPTTYGILMAYMGNFCFILATGPFAIWKRLVLVFSGICMFLAMAYAGSRTPIVLVPIGMIFFVLMNPRKEILIGAAMFL